MAVATKGIEEGDAGGDDTGVWRRYRGARGRALGRACCRGSGPTADRGRGGITTRRRRRGAAIARVALFRVYTHGDVVGVGLGGAL